MTERPVLFLLHGLGGSARAWDGVVAALGTAFEGAAIDLPGSGDATAAADLSVAGMVDHVVDIVRTRGASRWLLVGHSMGGKVATIVASRALAGEPGLCQPADMPQHAMDVHRPAFDRFLAKLLHALHQHANAVGLILDQLGQLEIGR